MHVLLALSLSWTVTACGNVPSRWSIEEHPTATESANTQGTKGPFHSLIGWTEKVTFYVDDVAPDAVVEASLLAAQSWNDAMGREVLTFAGVAKVPRGDSLYSSLEDSTTMVYHEKNWQLSTAKAEMTLATTIWENAAGSDRIVKADIILNGETYKFCDAELDQDTVTSDLEIVDAQTVLTHEFGHLLGLDHVEFEADADSVMHAKTFIGPHMSFRALSAGDVANIRQLYE